MHSVDWWGQWVPWLCVAWLLGGLMVVAAFSRFKHGEPRILDPRYHSPRAVNESIDRVRGTVDAASPGGRLFEYKTAAYPDGAKQGDPSIPTPWGAPCGRAWEYGGTSSALLKRERERNFDLGMRVWELEEQLRAEKAEGQRLRACLCSFGQATRDNTGRDVLGDVLREASRNGMG